MARLCRSRRRASVGGASAKGLACYTAVTSTLARVRCYWRTLWPPFSARCGCRLRAATRIRIGNEHPDRLLTYPDAYNLSACAQPIRIRTASASVRSGMWALALRSGYTPELFRPSARARSESSGTVPAWSPALTIRLEPSTKTTEGLTWRTRDSGTWA